MPARPDAVPCTCRRRGASGVAASSAPAPPLVPCRPAGALRLRWLGGPRVAYRDAHALPAGVVGGRLLAPTTGCLLLEHSACLHRRRVRSQALSTCSSTPAAVGRPSCSGSTAAATSRTTARASSWATPCFRCASGPSATPCYVHEVEQLVIDVLAGVGPPGCRPARRLPRRLGWARRPPTPGRYVPSGLVTAGSGRCTASPSTSTPHWPC